jgi:hypothetical protein
MKFTKTAIATSAIALLSANVLAGQYVSTVGNMEQRYSTKMIQTTPAQSKQEAYQRGLNKLQQLSASSPVELKQALRIVGQDVASRSLHLNNDGYVTVNEYMDADGQIYYKGQVNVSYHYAERDSDD